MTDEEGREFIRQHRPTIRGLKDLLMQAQEDARVANHKLSLAKKGLEEMSFIHKIPCPAFQGGECDCCAETFYRKIEEVLKEL